MDTGKLKRFAPALRLKLIEQVSARLNYVLNTDSAELREKQGQVNQLRREIRERGQDAVIDQVAYTWFNRLAALRFLDARDWHRFHIRVIAAQEGFTQPEILQEVRKGHLPDGLELDSDRVDGLLDGRIPSRNPESEVYGLLLLAVCNYYHRIMPFLFEKLADYTELLLPDDLLGENSAVGAFRTEISDDDCAEVEILGWLYQFYISEKKDAVMARKKAVPSEDIPAVTQLFTPHWIVRYLVENSLGRLWLRSRPLSRLKEHMPYYVEDPEGQTPTDSLTVDTPEEIKLLDPACGSGHMLTYAFDLLVKIYEEEGHAPSEIPEKILTHNLFGLEICPRAAQLAQFALVCKAREQSRAAFRRLGGQSGSLQPQITCLRDVVLTPDEMQAWSAATGVKLSSDELGQIHQFRENTETFGSLIQPVLDGGKLAALVAKIGEQASAGDLLVQNTHRKLRLVLDQAEMLSQRYQVVVANPPYMGFKQMNSALRTFGETNYNEGARDLFGMFIQRCLTAARPNGHPAMITMDSWMYGDDHTDLREWVYENVTCQSMLHLGPGAFDEIDGEVVQVTAFVFSARRDPTEEGLYFRLVSLKPSAEKERAFIERKHNFRAAFESFADVPRKVLAYQSTQRTLDAFREGRPLREIAEAFTGLQTGDNPRFIHYWFEVSRPGIGFLCEDRESARETGLRWFPYVKGSDFRKWFGNNVCVLDWLEDGKEIREHPSSTVRNSQYYFQGGLAYNNIANSFSVRHVDSGFICDQKNSMFFGPSHEDLQMALGFLNSPIVEPYLEILSPKDFNPGSLKVIPILLERADKRVFERVVKELVGIARADWDNFETSWDFRDLPLLRPGDWEVEPGQPGGPWKGRTLAESWDHYATYCNAAIRRMQELETENNRLWIDAYGLQDELDSAVPEKEITLARADARKDMAAFLSYAVGCMMGRYSLDHPGLILADAGDTVEHYLAKVGKPIAELSFPPDDDAIIPVLEGEWFEDDIVARTREFLRVTFGSGRVDENHRFLEDSFGKDLRKYFLADFYKDHVQTYKKRPIYWLFQSPKKCFSALVYLHRYTRDTVNTLLNNYVRDFLVKLKARKDNLTQITLSESANARDKTQAQKEITKIEKMIKDVEDYEHNILLPLAQQRLEIDLDDGVKANYPKFGKALAPIAGLS
jgi:hypothetical protein